jgi:UDP-hydrolysing UDP-N-acetyl-D-glucosamine 2-epimerase
LRVFNTGSPNLDHILKNNLLSKNDLLKKLKIPYSLEGVTNFVLCVEHPHIPDAENSGVYMSQILNILDEYGFEVIVIYPNNDPGNDAIIQEIEKFQNNHRFHIFKNLDRKIYLSVMKHCLFMIGNSSSGIVESAAFNLPVINIGPRNYNRECSENVLNVENNTEKIRFAINKVISEDFMEKCNSIKNKYGNMDSGRKIVEILEEIELDFKLIDKKFVLR